MASLGRVCRLVVQMIAEPHGEVEEFRVGCKVSTQCPLLERSFVDQLVGPDCL